MGECICSSCKNLKAIIDDNGAADNYECSFGFPSEECNDCSVDPDNCECDFTCDNYECDDETDIPVVLNCKGCGKELRQVCSDGKDGDVFCIDCYLKNENDSIR